MKFSGIFPAEIPANYEELMKIISMEKRDKA
jgi:hypothetical protein